MLHFLRGLMIGISIAAPVGPIGILCIRRTFTQGRLFGFVSGLGAATADAIYGSIAGFGLATISNFLFDYKFWIQLVGGLFLSYLGVRTFRTLPNDNPVSTQGRSLMGSYTSVLFLTIANPMTILSFVGIFAGLGLSNPQNNLFYVFMLIFVVFLGSVLWWLFLCSCVGLLRNRLNTLSLIWINRTSGIAIFAFGVAALYGLYK
jgi:threonine/homoserine/homoserine lactone efflux protein